LTLAMVGWLEDSSYSYPAIGSHVRPRLCSKPISAAISTCLTVPPRHEVSPAAAIDVATPISAMHPPSAADIVARFLQSIPIAAEVKRN
jgi:hypothetical protein